MTPWQLLASATAVRLSPAEAHPLPSAPYCVLTFLRQRNVMTGGRCICACPQSEPAPDQRAGRRQVLSERPRYSVKHVHASERARQES